VEFTLYYMTHHPGPLLPAASGVDNEILFDDIVIDE